MNRLISILFLLVMCVLAQADQLTIGSVSEQIRQAEYLHEEARIVDHGWVITRKLIEQAKAALADDQLISADELSKLALRTAQASVDQSIRQEEVWRARIPSS
ncbi:MAG: hypothetical protein HON77_08125 [Gammaproteobacteria bacterium]|nr:hypothetical protein [Gammaproteobacteria bacterium]MBT5723033.1 hypothetical protein [Gammaproteobacteria bacterium]MBT6584257.1 hypothetical protein [Gammaproteobacteria bacterium]MBT7877627.1 hypothetical protein [Gammaproteobacteria bacterium]